MKSEGTGEPKARKGAAHDPETGEVRERTSKRRWRRELTPEERAVIEERSARRRVTLCALEALSRALVADGDPPLREQGLVDVSRAREVAVLLRIPRLSGQGGPGSSLVVSVRDYDGGNGGEPGLYVLVHVEYHDGNGFKCRTRGVKIQRCDLRPLARALNGYADECDARDAEANEGAA